RLAEAVEVDVEGYGEGMPRDGSNLFYRSFARLYEVAGERAPAVRVRMRLEVPPGRGLGSSATAVIGGLVAANEMMGAGLEREDLLRYAIELEHGRHADNVAPALLGGLVVNVVDGERVVSLGVPFPEELRAVLFVPELEMDTV